MTTSMNRPLSDSRVVLREQERAVLALIAAGYSNRQLSDRLCISLNTVKTHIRAAYRDIGVTTRPQAILWAVRHGLVDLDELFSAGSYPPLDG